MKPNTNTFLEENREKYKYRAVTDQDYGVLLILSLPSPSWVYRNDPGH